MPYFAKTPAKTHILQILRIPCKQGHSGQNKEKQNYDKSTFCLPRQVSCMTTQPFANLGKTGHNKADELNDTTDLTTKGARLDA